MRFHTPDTLQVSYKAGTNVARITGHAAVFFDKNDPDTEFKVGPFRERIARGAFDEVMDQREDVVALFNHDANWPLGRRSSRTLELDVDRRGLKFSITADSDMGREVAGMISRGDVKGASFSAVVNFESVTEAHEDGEPIIRTINTVDRLIDVGPVTIPAFDATDVAARCKDSADRIRRFCGRDRVLREMALANMRQSGIS